MSLNANNISRGVRPTVDSPVSAERLKVCVVHNAYGRFSGEEKVVGDVCALLTEAGHRVVTFCKESAPISTRWMGKPRAFFSGIYSVGARREFRRLLMNERPNVVNVHNLFPLISPSILLECKRQNVPVVMTLHNYRLTCPIGLHLLKGRICNRCAGGREYSCALNNCTGHLPKSIGYAVRSYFARCARIYERTVTLYLLLSEFQRHHLINAGFPADRMIVVGNPGPRPRTIEERCTFPNSAGYVAYIGRVSREKGIGTLLEAARRLPDIPFRIAGAVGDFALERETSPANVTYLGAIAPDDVLRFLGNAAFVVLPSQWYEGFPAVLLEAMAAGKAVVCSRIGGLPEIVDDGKTGLLVSPGDPGDLASAIQVLWSDPDRIAQLGAAGRRKLASTYSHEQYLTRITHAFQNAIAMCKYE